VKQRLEALAPQDGPATLLDLCSGLGFLGMLLAEVLPADRVHACVLLDQAWPMKGGVQGQPGARQDEKSEDKEAAEEEVEEAVAATGSASTAVATSRRRRTRLNWDHIYGLPWPITLTTRRADLKLPSTHAQILAKILEPAPGPVFILGVHLCGVLSIRAVETFNRGPKCVGLVLKPCCLPAMEYMKRQTHWTLGAHSFAASEVCMWGKYNRNQWQGPAKATLASRFGRWADNLYRGILAENKHYDRVSLVDGHYQNAYLIAEREFSHEVPPPPPGPEEDVAALVQQVLNARTCYDVLGVPEGISMRPLKRRWVALTKLLGAVEQDLEDGARAFRRVKEAYDEIRAGRAGNNADQ